jgi:hypothetical protein
VGPVNELRVGDQRTQLLDRFAIEHVSPVTMIITSYSLAGKSCKTCSNSFNADDSEWNSRLSESSIRILWISKIAKTANASAMRIVEDGARNGMTNRSAPNAMPNRGCLGRWADQRSPACSKPYSVVGLRDLLHEREQRGRHRYHGVVRQPMGEIAQWLPVHEQASVLD